MNDNKLFAKAFLHLFKLITARRIAEVLEVDANQLKALKKRAVDLTAIDGGIDDRGDAGSRHGLKRTVNEPGKPDVFIARCNYQSDKKEEFTITGKVTCEACNG